AREPALAERSLRDVRAHSSSRRAARAARRRWAHGGVLRGRPSRDALRHAARLLVAHGGYALVATLPRDTLRGAAEAEPTLPRAHAQSRRAGAEPPHPRRAIEPNPAGRVLARRQREEPEPALQNPA